MKKIVYVCGSDGLSSECEILYEGSMIIVKHCGDEELVGIDIVSMIEITGDMIDVFISKGSPRKDSVDSLVEIRDAAMSYLDLIKKGGAV